MMDEKQLLNEEAMKVINGGETGNAGMTMIGYCPNCDKNRTLWQMPTDRWMCSACGSITANP